MGILLRINPLTVTGFVLTVIPAAAIAWLLAKPGTCIEMNDHSKLRTCLITHGGFGVIQDSRPAIVGLQCRKSYHVRSEMGREFFLI
jgi:hypothetical protein